MITAPPRAMIAPMATAIPKMAPRHPRPSLKKSMMTITPTIKHANMNPITLHLLAQMDATRRPAKTDAQSAPRARFARAARPCWRCLNRGYTDISSAIVYAHAFGVERFSKLVTKHAHHFAPQFFRGDAQIAAGAKLVADAHSGFGVHSRASRCASAICADVIFPATASRFFVASALPRAAARLNHMCARI